jgi:glycosyltransferase involved in cell wall biosynthesis
MNPTNFKLAIFIPCYNVKNRIKKFLKNFDEATLERIGSLICVDNASTDGTLKSLKDLKSTEPRFKDKLLILSNKKNYGLGGSHKIVFNFLAKQEFTHCLILPSNYIGSPKEVAKLFLDYHQNHPEVDVILGTRQFKSNMKLDAWVVDKFHKKISEPIRHLLSDYNFSDIGSRFLFFKTDVLDKIPYKALSDGREFTLQFNVLLSETPNIKFEEIPLKKWAFSRTNTLKLIRYNSKLLQTMTKFGVNKYIFQKKGWRLFNDYPDNTEREYEVL